MQAQTCQRKETNVFSQPASFRKTAPGRRLVYTGSCRYADIGFRKVPSLGKWLGKECGSVRRVSVPARVVLAGSPVVTVSGIRKSGRGLMYSYIRITCK